MKVDLTKRPAQTSKRLDWIDAVRGIGIVAVVVGHVWRGLNLSSLIGRPDLFARVDRLIYAFHMPLLFFISGIVFYVSTPKTMGKAFSSRIVRLIWPLFLWTWIYFTFKVVSGSLVNTPLSLENFPFFPLPPREHFWFLWALFLIQTIVMLAMEPFGKSALGLSLLGLISLALYAYPPVTPGLAPWLVGAVGSAAYFVLGMAYGRLGPDLPVSESAWPYLILFAIAEAMALAVSGNRAVDLIIGALAAVSLTTAVRSLAAGGSGARWLDWLRTLGLASMAIYVTHIIFASSVRIALKILGVQNLWIHVLLGTCAGVFIPYALYLLAKRLGVTRLVGF